jgi:8-oxo-dGTP pyrophosphatase MutT (NUDIX family)
VLLQHRAAWSHHGGTWGLLGGARDSGETAEQTAAREAVEEAGLDPRCYAVTGRFVDDHGGWSYTTVIARTDLAALPDALTAETVEVRWVPADRLGELPLHPGFAATWALVRQASNAAGSMVTGKGSDSVSCCPGSARPTST